MYYKKILDTQFSDSNGTGHVDHLAYADWFDRARTYLYRELDPTLRFHPHGLVVVTTTVYYLQEASLLDGVEIRTWVSRIARKSLEIQQDCWQHGTCCAQCKTVFCGFNVETRQSEILLDRYREVLERFEWDERVQES